MTGFEIIVIVLLVMAFVYNIAPGVQPASSFKQRLLNGFFILLFAALLFKDRF